MTKPLQVSELFYSIQGESTWAGLPCLFIRLAGCNLGCSFCDARYSWQEPGQPMTPTEILAWVAATPGVLVELTGGEPLLQQGAIPLMEQLVNAGRRVLLETNGSLPLDPVPGAVHIVMDIKGPGSGMAAHTLWPNLEVLRTRKALGSRDQVKFVLTSAEDFHWARQVVLREDLAATLPVLFSPVQPSLDPAALAALLLESRLPVRLQLQLHTLLWPGQNRGV